MERRRLFGGIAIMAAVAAAGGPAGAEPSPGFVVPFECDGIVVELLHAPGGGDVAWAVQDSTPTGSRYHIKTLEFRVYAGDLPTEPAGEQPIATGDKSYGERVGQGEPVACHGRRVVPSEFGTVTLFIDVEATVS